MIDPTIQGDMSMKKNKEYNGSEDIRSIDPWTKVFRNAIGNSKSTTKMSYPREKSEQSEMYCAWPEFTCENLLMILPAGVDMMYEGATPNKPLTSAEWIPFPALLYSMVSPQTTNHRLHNLRSHDCGELPQAESTKGIRRKAGAAEGIPMSLLCEQ